MRRRLTLAGLLAPPLLWLVVAYLGALAAIFATAVWTTDQPLIRSRSMPARKPRRSLKNKGPCLTEPRPP